MALTNVAEVSKRLGRPITDADEVNQVTAWIQDVETIIMSRVPDLDERILAGTISEHTVNFVAANAVVRKAKNPDGKQNERVDDYSYGLTEDAARGDLFLTDDEWALLLGTTGGDAFMIRMVPQSGFADEWSR